MDTQAVLYTPANKAEGGERVPGEAPARVHGGLTMERMLVVGAGTMGAQIAMVCALAGHDTTVTDLTDDALARAESSLRSRLDRDVAKGRRTRDDVDDAFARLTFTTDLDVAASTADLVIEAAVEKLDVKREVFARSTSSRRRTRSSPRTRRRSCRRSSPTPPGARTASPACTSSTRRS